MRLAVACPGATNGRREKCYLLVVMLVATAGRDTALNKDLEKIGGSRAKWSRRRLGGDDGGATARAWLWAKQRLRIWGEGTCR
jgi:hypothetical protein